MYYEEKLINGVLMFRTRPDGDWQQVSIEKLSQRFIEMKQAFLAAKGFIDSHVADPDITSEMVDRYAEYQDARLTVGI